MIKFYRAVTVSSSLAVTVSSSLSDKREDTEARGEKNRRSGDFDKHLYSKLFWQNKKKCLFFDSSFI